MDTAINRTLKRLSGKAARWVGIAVVAMGMMSNGYSMTAGEGGTGGFGGGSGATVVNGQGPRGGGMLVLPGDIASSNKKYPVMIWGPGMGTTPSLYTGITRQFASAGIVVFSQTSTGNGSEMKAAIDWLVEQNKTPNSRVYQKLDTSKIAVGGHSLGGMSSFTASSDPRVITSVHAAGGSFIPGGRRGLTKPTLYIGGTADFATSAMQGDYQKATGPIFMTVIQGGGHAGIPFQASDMMTSWLRWHLLGETQRKSEFISPNCKYCGQGYNSKSKGF